MIASFFLGEPIYDSTTILALISMILTAILKIIGVLVLILGFIVLLKVNKLPSLNKKSPNNDAKDSENK